MIKQLKLFSAHIAIFIISVFCLGYGYGYIGNNSIGNVYGIFHFLVILGLYLASGYFITNKTEKFQLKKYWIIALIGICIWIFAFINSPTDLDWKKGNGGLLWLLYRLYITSIELPFCFSDYLPIEKYHISIKHIYLLFLSILPSVLQAIGGYLRTKNSK